MQGVQAEYFGLDKEDNPALGYQAIRICLTRKELFRQIRMARKEIFRQQLRAIPRASAYGTVSVMFPMIISVRQVRYAKELLEECRVELMAEGKAVGELPPDGSG